MTLDRRQLLGTSAAAIAVGLLPRAASAVTVTVPPAPVARVEVVKDMHFGETLSDPYRWMENSKDKDWLPFLKAENDRTRAVLDQLPARAGLLRRVEQLSGDTVATSRVQRAGGRLFYQQRPLGADNFKLFVKDGTATRVLIDPIAMSSATSHVSLDWWRASPDGSRLVYGLSKDGSEDSTLRIMVVATGKDLPETIPDTQAANPQWLDDGSGFFYNQLTGKVDTPERYLDSRARFHRIGTDPAGDPVLVQRGRDPALVYDKIQGPYIFTATGSRHALLVLGDVRPEIRLFVAPVADAVAGTAKWRPVAGFDDVVTGAELDGDDLYLVIEKTSPRGRVVKTSAATPDLAAAAAVPESALVIESIDLARDGLYLRLLDGGISRLRRLGNDGRVTDIALPFDGTIGAVFANPDEDGVLISYGGWYVPTGVWSVSAGGVLADTGLTPRPAIDVAAYASVRAFATARDGTKIPYSLLYRKDRKRDGTAPTYIQAYGSYGAVAYAPNFAGRALAFLDAGGIIGYANVRGGGEYGREWHRAGQLENKPNTWRDLIAVCETVIKDGWTSSKHLAIGGRSAGGITVGRALTERPELFAAVVSGVGWSNPLRYVVEQNGYGEEPEWGAIAEEKGYRALKSIDSYQAVRDGANYPAVLLTTGVTDPRVAPFHVAKMTARLQAASASGKPVLMRVDFDAGHGVGSTRAQQDRETADIFAFLLWRLGGAGGQA